MKRTYIKKVLGELGKAIDQKGYRECEIMELNMKTCISPKAELFVSVEATLNEPGKNGKSYKVRKDFDL